MIASLAHSKFRKTHGLFLVEGEHAVLELLRSSWRVRTVLISENFADSQILDLCGKRDLERVGSRIIGKIATTKTPQDIVAVAVIPPNDLKKVTAHDRIIIADGIKDPGNMGTIIRTAEALGFGALITTAGSVDIYNPKVVRATQGALFTIDIAQRIVSRDIIKALLPSHTLYAMDISGEMELPKLKPEKRSALVIGSEIAGVSGELTEAAKTSIRIPIKGRAESLNAAIAAGIAMYLFNK